MTMTYLGFGKDTIRVCLNCINEDDFFAGQQFVPWHDECAICHTVYTN